MLMPSAKEIKLFIQYYLPFLRDQEFYEKAVNEKTFFTDRKNKTFHILIQSDTELYLRKTLNS